jgi:hypothetical protein
MIPVPSGVQVWLATGHTDMRKGFDGLAVLVQETLKRNPTTASRSLLGIFAEYETNLRRERQLEDIAKAKAAGVYRGRKPSIDPACG